MTNPELAILSLIAEQPRYGYEIEQVIEERGMREWTEVGFSSIYYVLRKLEGKGWVESRTESSLGKGPARTVYHITAAGREACRDATLEALSVPRPQYPPLLLGLANLPGLSSDEAVAALRQYRDRLADRRDHVRTKWAREKQPVPFFVDAMFDLSVTLIEAELAWLMRFTDQIATNREEAPAMTTLDLAKLHKQSYSASQEPNIVDVPDGNFLTLVGRGAPEGADFASGIEALYAVAYRVKFMTKPAGTDFVVGKLEGLWWFDDPQATSVPREEWNWKLMIRLPDFVTADLVSKATQEVLSKKQLHAVLKIAFEPYPEGLSAQVLHVGPFSAEAATIARLHEFIHANGYRPRGLHHEIYLSDARRTAPEKLQTIIRQPVQL